MNPYILPILLHKVSCAALIIGVILLIIWAAKNLKKDALKKLAVILIIAGLAGSLLTIGVMKSGRGSFTHGKMMMNSERHEKMMEMMMNEDMNGMMGEEL